ncbi:MAG: hypothetical protein LBN20_01580 [Endomicrobium sp.]|jgi:probable addiction module antidote protein|nr:hypothetical protein [Endomicrobium sp.]
MKPKKDLELTLNDIQIGEDFSEYYADYLKTHPDRLQHYKKYIVQEYNKTKDRALFLSGLQTVARAEGKINEIAKSAKVGRTSVYRMLSDNSNPSFDNVLASAAVLGISFNACLAR